MDTGICDLFQLRTSEWSELGVWGYRGGEEKIKVAQTNRFVSVCHEGANLYSVNQGLLKEWGLEKSSFQFSLSLPFSLSVWCCERK